MSAGGSERDDFFVGYMGRLPAYGRGVVWLFILCFLAAFAGGGVALSISQSDPGDGGGAGRATVQGVIVAEPYPHLREAPSADNPLGRTIVLNSARGKRGVQKEAAEFDGQFVEVTGGILRRGEIETIQVGFAQGAHRIAPVEGADKPTLSPVEDLGRWRIAGEMCDSKCYLGVMRPGRGLAHKACANLCTIGGAPLVYVTNVPVEGETFLLLADAEGGPLPDAYRDWTALFMSIEGQLERHGALLIFKVDLSTAQRL